MKMEMSYGMTGGFNCKSEFIFDGINLIDCVDLLIGCLIVFVSGIMLQYFLSKEQKLFSLFERNIESDQYLLNSEKYKDKAILVTIRLIILILVTCLMFAIMTYNLWFSVVFVVSYAIGYLIFLDLDGRRVESATCCQIS